MNKVISTEYVEKNYIRKKDLIDLIDFAVNRTGNSNDYLTGMCNGMIYIKAVITDTAPEYLRVSEGTKDGNK